MSVIVSFTKMTNLAKVWQKLKQDDETGISIIVDFRKIKNVAKFANVARIRQGSGKITCNQRE